jgi:hypothetical protein
MSDMLNKITQHLEHTAHLNQVITEQNLSQQVSDLQTWQTMRLLTTHQDLWQSKRFKPAMQFFIDELYGPKDFSQRDAELARVVPKMSKVLPEKALISLEAALELNSLSLSLDFALVEDLNGETVDKNTYFESYRRVGQREKREQQIQLLEDLGIDLAQVVKISGISAILMLSRKPAKVAGVQSLHEFLEKGFKAFKKLGKVHDFIDPIIDRERQMMDDLFCASDVIDNPLPTPINS